MIRQESKKAALEELLGLRKAQHTGSPKAAHRVAPLKESVVESVKQQEVSLQTSIKL